MYNIGPDVKNKKFAHRGKRRDKKDKSKMKCYNCQNHGHFVREWTELKKVQIYSKFLIGL